MATDGSKIRAHTKKKTSSTYNNYGFGGGAAYVAGNVGIGIAGIAEGIADLVGAGVLSLQGDTTGAKALFDDSWSGEWKRDLDEWYNPDATMSFVGDVGQGIGSSLVALIPAAGVPLMAIGAAGGGVASAVQQTGELGVKELGYGAAVGVTEALLEKFVGPGMAKSSGVVTKGVSALGKSATKRTAKKAVFEIGEAAAKGLISDAGETAFKKVSSSTIRSAIRNSAFTTVLSNASEEFMEEAASEYLDSQWLRAFNIDPDAKASAQEIMRAGFVGAVSGSLLSGAQVAGANAYHTAKGARIIKNGNADNLISTAEAIASNPFYRDQIEIKNEPLKAMLESLNAYKALPAQKRTSFKGELLLGEIQSNLFKVEASAHVKPYKERLLSDLANTTEYANAFFGEASGK
ncbi:MAG: hypothetical protein IJY04_03750 [Clostridia bacterium]|nr:hypothetical protein [Clostridia bacterium]